MSYNRIIWSSTTPISESNLNRMDEGIKNLDPIDSLESESTTAPLSAKQGKVLNDKFSVDYIIEEGSNSNGNYIKYNSGLMICYKKVTFTNIEKSRSWNGRYISNSALSLGKFAKEFIDVPICSISLTSPYSILFLGDQVPTKTTIGTFYPLGFNSDTIANMEVNVIAYGKWK